MKCPILFSEKNKKNISKCRLLKILPRVLSVNTILYLTKYFNIKNTTVQIFSQHVAQKQFGLALRV